MGMTFEQMAMLEPTEDQVWRQAQKDYEGGVPVGEVCARYGLKRATVYQRAQVWRAAAGASFDPEAAAPKAADLAQAAWRRLGQAVEGGRIHEALCWRKMLESLEARAAKDAWAERIKGMDQDQAMEELLYECDKTVALDKARREAEAAPQPKTTPSLDTLPPASQTCEPLEEDEPPYDAESVRGWRNWAAVSDRLDQLGEEAAAGSRPLEEPRQLQQGLEAWAERERTGRLRV